TENGSGGPAARRRAADISAAGALADRELDSLFLCFESPPLRLCRRGGEGVPGGGQAADGQSDHAAHRRPPQGRQALTRPTPSVPAPAACGRARVATDRPLDDAA